jgi:16S rRNA (cytosine967-C5)-methyltransferase
MSSVANARAVALDCIRRVVEEDGYSTIVIPAALARSGLDARNRAFATELAFGTIRRLGSLDWAIARRASRPVARMTPGVRDVLRLGAYQVLFAGVAAHAAVAETVSLAAPKERGFANAVLRRLAADPPPWPSGTKEEDVAVRTGMSGWAVRELRRLLAANAETAAAGFAERAPLCVRTNTCVVTVEELERALVSAGHAPARSSLDPDCLLLDHGDPSLLPGFERGWFAVQDHASVAVVRALDPRRGERIFDACAAPGGKAAHLACLVGDEGVVVAGDLHPQRAALIRRSALRLRVHPHAVAQDATRPALRGPFDRVLVDAPCSGIGSARRRPELLWRPRSGALSPLARLQVAIASAAAELLAPGGRLVYSVCTFPRAETDAAADAILRHRPDLEPVGLPAPDGTAERFRLWPHLHGSDGMFVAGFRKRP